MAGPDLSVFQRNRGFSDYQRANEEFQARKALQQAQIQKLNAPETITPYQAASLDIQRKQLEQRNMPETMTPYQAASLDLQKQRIDLAKAKGGMYVDPDTGEITQGATQLKPLPSPLAKGIIENRQNLSRAQKALDLAQGKNVNIGGQTITGDTEATGWKGYLPNQILNRVDPKGVSTRSAIADLGSLVIHDRSGAAVTAAEFPRLAPFIPNEKDDTATVQKKLKNFVGTYKQLVDEGEAFYKETGYKIPQSGQQFNNINNIPQSGGIKFLGFE